jgi:hypothetical protein
MLTRDKIITVYCLIDDLLKAMGHKSDPRARVSDPEVITTAFVAALNYGGHLENARLHMKDYGLIPHMLDKSRLCRRLHRLGPLLSELFCVFGQQLKDIAGADDYVIDSFPVPACDNIRIIRTRLLQGKVWRGRWSAMRRWFYGVKVQVLTLHGVPVEFCIVPGSESDVKALARLPLNLPPESKVYADAGYTDYVSEDDLFDATGISLEVQRKRNSKRKDKPWTEYLKLQMRKGIETTFSMIKAGCSVTFTQSPKTDSCSKLPSSLLLMPLKNNYFN